jgi:hypothetical protein
MTPEDAEAIPLCRQCGCLVAIFPDRRLQWQHYRGDLVTSGGHGAPAAVAVA